MYVNWINTNNSFQFDLYRKEQFDMAKAKVPDYHECEKCGCIPLPLLYEFDSPLGNFMSKKQRVR